MRMFRGPRSIHSQEDLLLRVGVIKDLNRFLGQTFDWR